MEFFYINLILFYYRIEYICIKHIKAKKEDSILIIKLDAIGDMLIWLDSAQCIKETYKDKKVILLCNKVCKEIVESLPYFDEIIFLDKKKFLSKINYRLKFIKNISKRKFNKVINPVYSRDYFYQDILVHLIKSEEKIGYYSDYSNNEGILKGLLQKEKEIKKVSDKLYKKSNKFYTKLINKNKEALMEKSINAHFIREVINKDFLSNIPTLPFELPKLNSFTNLTEKEYIVIFVGASTSRKIWPTKNYIKLFKSLNEDKIVICGGKGEEFIWTKIKENIDESMMDYNILNLIGDTSLLELFSVIAGAKYIITNDTSASHITVLTKTPSVCLLGGAHYGRFQPYFIESLKESDILPKVANTYMDCYNCNLNCKYIKDKDTIWPCIEKIIVNQVLSKVNEIKQEYGF